MAVVLAQLVDFTLFWLKSPTGGVAFAPGRFL